MTNRTLSASFDREKALARVGGSEELLSEVIGLFVEQAPLLLAEIRRHLEAGDGVAVSKTTHLLRGSASLFGAPVVIDAAQRLEALAREGDMTGSANLFAQFEVDLTQLVNELSGQQEVTPPCAS